MFTQRTHYRCYIQSSFNNKCSDKSMEVRLSALLGNYDRPTDQSADQPTNGRTDRVIRIFHFRKIQCLLFFQDIFDVMCYKVIEFFDILSLNKTIQERKTQKYELKVTVKL